jgi:hypothetical protein
MVFNVLNYYTQQIRRALIYLPLFNKNPYCTLT